MNSTTLIHYEHKGVTLEVFRYQDGSCYVSFDLSEKRNYETVIHPDIRSALKDAIALIDAILLIEETLAGKNK